MKLRVIGVWMTFFLIAEIAIGVLLVAPLRLEQPDMPKINELVRLCQKAVESLKNGMPYDLPESEYSYRVLDEDGRLLFASNRLVSDSIHNAIENKDILIDLKAEDEAAGKIIISNSDNEIFETAKVQMMSALLLSAIFAAAIFFVYSVYLKRTVFAPFEKLKSFASRVAGGNLNLPLEMDKGNAFGAFTESFDIMREELKKSRENEMLANKSKQELVVKLSHDIKTPIASIKAIAEVMEVQAKTEKEKEQLAVIQAKVNQVDALISNLFHATLEELQELEVSPKEQLSTIIPGLLKASDYRQRASIGEIPSCIVNFDTLRLQQVFDNIIENSYKYADTPIKIEAGIEGRELFILFYDYGNAVSEEELLLITEKFYRGENAAGKSGVGLGLYISRFLLDKMGGSLECKNTETGFCVAVGLKI